MRFRAPRQQGDDDLRLELTSMTDIVFLLLIFFMVSTTFVDLSRQLDIQLPDTQAADVVQDVQRHVVELSAQNTLRLDGEDIDLSELTSQLTQRAGKARHRSVEIRADKRLPYGRVITVLGHVRQANIQDIAVAVR
jgi:biopolymer transport protein ExbD